MLKRILILSVIHLLAVAVSASNPVEIRAKEGVDFSRYVTYAWKSHDYLMADAALREGAPLDQKVRRAGDKLIESRGFKRVGKEESPDLIIHYVGMVEDFFQAEGVTQEIASGVKWIGDPNAHSMRSYSAGTLVFEVIDTQTEEMVWSGWATELAPTIPKLRDRAEKATRRVFRHFPSK